MCIRDRYSDILDEYPIESLAVVAGLLLNSESKDVNDGKS